MAQALPRTTLSSSAAATALHVALIYEDFSTGIKAKQVADYVAAEMGSGCSVDASFWNASLLDDAKLARIAEEDAATATVMVISLHSGRSLSPTLRLWIEQWASRCYGTHPAMVTLFDGAKDPSTMEAREFLRKIAEESGIEFLSGNREDSPAELR